MTKKTVKQQRTSTVHKKRVAKKKADSKDIKKGWKWEKSKHQPIPEATVYEVTPPEEIQESIQRALNLKKKMQEDKEYKEALKEEGRKQGMVQGLVLAIALMYKGEDERGIWRSAGLTISECIANEVAECDIDEIIKHGIS